MKEIKNQWGLIKMRQIRLLKQIGLVDRVWVESNDKDIPLSYYKSNSPDAILQFHSFDTIQRKYGVKFLRHELGVTDYQPSTARLKAGRAEFQTLITAKNEVNAATEEIPMQEFSTQTDVQKTVDATSQLRHHYRR